MSKKILNFAFAEPVAKAVLAKKEESSSDDSSDSDDEEEKTPAPGTYFFLYFHKKKVFSKIILIQTLFHLFSFCNFSKTLSFKNSN